MIDSIKNVASLSATRGLGSIATDLTSAASGVLGSSPAVAMGTTAGMSFA